MESVNPFRTVEELERLKDKGRQGESNAKGKGGEGVGGQIAAGKEGEELVQLQEVAHAEEVGVAICPFE